MINVTSDLFYETFVKIPHQRFQNIVAERPTFVNSEMISCLKRAALTH